MVRTFVYSYLIFYHVNDILGDPEPTPMIMPTITKKLESTTLHSQLVKSFVSGCICSCDLTFTTEPLIQPLTQRFQLLCPLQSMIEVNSIL